MCVCAYDSVRAYNVEIIDLSNIKPSKPKRHASRKKAIPNLLNEITVVACFDYVK